MKRREFLKASLAVSTLAGLNCAQAQARAGSNSSVNALREYYELRVYHLKSSGDRGLLDTYLSKALIPALNELDSRPVGVFVQQERTGAHQPTEVIDLLAVWVLIPHMGLAGVAESVEMLPAGGAYQSAGAEYLQSPKTKPAFERIDSWLMLAFAGMPRVELPAYCKEKKPRMFEMRTYESYSESKALKKVEMFNSGEIQLMREVGLGPIFYGQALIGSNLPHLTYMVSAEDQEAHKKHWDAFKAHPTWDKLKNDPQYADTVSKIYNRFLVPTPYSQIDGLAGNEAAMAEGQLESRRRRGAAVRVLLGSGGGVQLPLHGGCIRHRPGFALQRGAGGDADAGRLFVGRHAGGPGAVRRGAVRGIR